MEVVDAITHVILTGQDVYLSCRDEKHSESIRVSAFQIRKSMKKADKNLDVSIQKVVEDNKLFIRIFRKEAPEVFVKNKDGGFVPLENKKDNELERIIALMRKDGKTEDRVPEGDAERLLGKRRARAARQA